MSTNYIHDYIKAGKGVIAAKKLAREIIVPGQSFLDIANRCEAEITKSGCELAFPINMSLDEIAAHYSPLIGDENVIPEKGLLKIDIGAHFNGYIADSAFTINLNEDPDLQNYVDAAKEALDAAIELFNPGVRLYELGEVIARKINKRNLRPIKNLGGHALKQFDLHAGAFIPNYRDKIIEKLHYQILQPGDAYACEPFSTSGVGEVDNGNNFYIYRLVKKVKRARKNIPYKEQVYMSKVETNFKQLPFSPRWIDKLNLFPTQNIQTIINLLLRRKVLDRYPILIEKSNKPVAQEEHTIILDMDGKKIVTTKE